MAEYSEKVRSKLGRKGIELDDVELVLADPERDRHVYSRHIGGRLLLVVVEGDDHNEVVTAFYQTTRQRKQYA